VQFANNMLNRSDESAALPNNSSLQRSSHSGNGVVTRPEVFTFGEADMAAQKFSQLGLLAGSGGGGGSRGAYNYPGGAEAAAGSRHVHFEEERGGEPRSTSSSSFPIFGSNYSTIV
jgi:hypothetical protein